jgi:hypothetical protein
MRSKECLQNEKHTFRYYDLVKKTIYDLYPLRRDKIKTFEYLNRYLYADARYEAESKNCNGDISKENFELIDGEVDPNIAALVRLEILNTILLDDTFIFAYNYLVHGDNTYTNYPKLKGYSPKVVDENTLNNINKLICSYKEDYPKNKLCMFLTDIDNKNYHDKSNYKLSKDYNWWLKAFNMAYEIFDKIRVNSSNVNEALITVEDINTGDDALDLTVKEIICYLSDRYNFDIAKEQRVMLSLLSDFIEDKYIKQLKEADLVSDRDETTTFGALTCSQQTKAIVLILKELGVNFNNTAKIIIARVIKVITGRNLQNIRIRMEINYKDEKDIKDLEVVADFFKELLPSLSKKIKENIKLYS